MLFLSGLGWYSVLVVMMFWKWLGFIFCKRLWMLLFFNWKIFLVLFCCKSWNVVLLFRGNLSGLICLLVVCLIILMVIWRIVRLWRLRKFIFSRLVFFMFFIDYCVIMLFLLEILLSGMYFVNGLLLIMIVVVCVLMLCVKFLILRVKLINFWILLLLL